LTDGYVAGTVISNVHNQNQLVLLVKFTIGSLTNADIKVEFSPDNSNYYQEAFSSISTTTSTESLGFHRLSASGNYRIPIAIKDRFIKISVIGNGTVTNSTCTIDAIIGIS
jgi:hypothetical protein